MQSKQNVSWLVPSLDIVCAILRFLSNLFLEILARWLMITIWNNQFSKHVSWIVFVIYDWHEIEILAAVFIYLFHELKACCVLKTSVKRLELKLVAFLRWQGSCLRPYMFSALPPACIQPGVDGVAVNIL